MLKIGELAARTGLTVRTLHHYDSIGLLKPSARSDAGYRLYGPDDLARLMQILALQRFGLALADIGAYLDRPEASPLALLDRQLAVLDRQIGEAERARAQLLQLRGQLVRGEAPGLSDWLTTLEHMTMYEHYFTTDELAQLPLYHDPAAQQEWRALVKDVQALMDAGGEPDSEAAQALVARWMTILERDTAGNQDWLLQLDFMHEREPLVQQATGITPNLKAFVMKAMAALRLELYARYLPEQAMAFMRRHHAGRGREWPALMRRIRAQMAADPSAQTEAAHALAKEWHALFHDMIGPDPAVIPQFRQAVESEPLLRLGRGMSEAMLAYLRQALER
jgi:DNA-binding transcriptional MerR regulator